MLGAFSSLISLDIASILASPMMFAITILLLSQKHHAKTKLFAFFIPALFISGMVTVIGYVLGQTVPGTQETNTLERYITIGIGVLFLFFALRTWRKKETFHMHHNAKGMKPWKWFVISFLFNISNVDTLILTAAAGRAVGNIDIPRVFQWMLLSINAFFYTFPILFPIFLTFLFPSLAKRVLSNSMIFLKTHGRHVISGMFFFLGMLFLFHGFRSFSQHVPTTPALYETIKTALPQAPSVTRTIVDVSDMHVWWISPDDYSIIVDGVSGIEVRTFDCEKDTESRDAFVYTTNVIDKIVDKIMREYGFTENQKNSSQGISDDRFYDYVHAYERGKTKCVFSASPDCSSYIENDRMHYTFSFVCTDAYEKSYEEQISYLRDLGLHDAVIHVEKQERDFVRLNINYRRSGHYTIAKRTDGAWKELLSGQDIPLCSVVAQYQIPKALIGECYKEGQ